MQVLEKRADLENIFFSILDELLLVNKTINDLAENNCDILGDIIKHILSNSGKRIRPAIVILSSKLNNTIGLDLERAINIAAISELIHIATLVHDDIIDGSRFRRGAESINFKWDNKTAVLVGDFFYIEAMKFMLSDKQDKKYYKIANLFSQTISVMCSGEINQSYKQGIINISETDYIKIICEKTARFMSSCCVAGGILSNANDRKIKTLEDIGIDIGIAFQIVDDLLDIDSNMEIIGKPTDQDLREKKVTLPFIYTYRNASPFDRNTIEEYFLSETADEERLGIIKSLIKEYGGIDYATKVASNYCENARQMIAREFPLSPARDTFEKLINYICDRSN